MTSILAAVVLALAEWLNRVESTPDRVGSVDIRGNKGPADEPIRDAANLCPGMLLPVKRYWCERSCGY